MLTFILGMIVNPAAQSKAQAELDRVCQGQLPTFEDAASLPYLQAAVYEAHRWKPNVPLAGPRFVTEEDDYKGYRIPANSIVIGNAWAMLHDEVCASLKSRKLVVEIAS
jgi:cytochrome P450